MAKFSPWEEGYVDPNNAPVEGVQTVVDPAVAAQTEKIPVINSTQPVDSGVQPTKAKYPWEEGYVDPNAETPVDSPMSAEDPSAVPQRPMNDLKVGDPNDDNFTNIKAGVERDLTVSQGLDDNGGIMGPEAYDEIGKRHGLISQWDQYWGGTVKGEAAINSIENLPDTMFGPNGLFKVSKDQIIEDYNQREAEEDQLYSKIGKPEEALGMTHWGDYPMRIQRKIDPNLDFDPAQPESEDNPKEKTTKFFVPPPDQNRFIAFGYQVARNLAGIGDMAYDAVMNQKLNLSEEGVLREKMPQAPMSGVEKTVADITSFVLGPGLTFKAGKEVAGATKSLTKTATSAFAKRAVTYMSPTSIARTKQVYDTAIKAGKSVSEATEASQAFMKKVLMGASLGLVESSIAEDDSSGMITPEFLKEYTGVDERTAHDLSLMLDTPVTNGVLNTLGALWNTGGRKIEDTFGGIRATRVKNIISISEKESGLYFATAIDPNLLKDGPDVALAKLKMLGDHLTNQEIERLTIGGTSIEVKNDSVTALLKVGQKYFRQAYAEKEIEMGKKAFNDWVTEQATNAANQMVSVRTGLKADPLVARSMASKSLAVENVFRDQADAETLNATTKRAQQVNPNAQPEKGNMVETQDDMSKILADNRTANETAGAIQVDKAKQRLDTANQNFEEGFKSNPEVSNMVEKAKTEFELGSGNKINAKLKTTLGDKVFKAFRKNYDDVQKNYDVVKANKDLKIDEVAFLEKLRELGGVDETLIDDAIPRATTTDVKNSGLLDDVEKFYKERGTSPPKDVAQSINTAETPLSDPIFKEIGDMVINNPTYSNALTHVHNKIQGKIKELSKSAGTRDTDLIERLRKLEFHIFKEQADLIPGAPDIKTALKKASDSYIKYRTAWEDLPQLRNLSQIGKARYNAETANGGLGIPKGETAEGQNVAEWNDVSIKTWDAEKDSRSGEYIASLRRAAKSGEANIDNDMVDILELETAKSFADKGLTADQDITTFRSAMKRHVELLEKFDSPKVKEFKDLEQKLVKIEKEVKDADEAFKQKSKVFTEYKSGLDNSVAAKFMSEVEGVPHTYTGLSDARQTMATMFKAKDSGNQIEKLMKKAKEIGGDRGEAIEEALRGSYMDYIGQTLRGNTDIGGIAEMTADDSIKVGKSVRALGIETVNTNPAFKKNVIALWGKERYDEIQNVVKNLNDATRAEDRGTPFGSKILPGEDAQKGMAALRIIALGVLDPTSTMVSRFTNPFGEIKLEQMKQAKRVAVVAALLDVKTMNRYMKLAPAQQLQKEELQKFRKLIIRAAVMTEAKDKESNKFEVPRAVVDAVTPAATMAKDAAVWAGTAALNAVNPFD